MLRSLKGCCFGFHATHHPISMTCQPDVVLRTIAVSPVPPSSDIRTHTERSFCLWMDMIGNVPETPMTEPPSVFGGRFGPYKEDEAHQILIGEFTLHLNGPF